MYIGQKKRNLETKEHFRNLRLNHTEKSATVLHCWNTGHEINNSSKLNKFFHSEENQIIQHNSVNLLKLINKKNELIIWEKIFVHKHAHHIMNFEVTSDSSLIKK